MTTPVRCPKCGAAAAHYEPGARWYRCTACGEVTNAEDMPAVDGLAGWLEAMADTGQLPSQLLAYAQELNPDLEIAIEYRPTAVIVVKTAARRGRTRTASRARIGCVTFRRAGLL